MPKIVDHAAYKRELVEKSFELMARRGYYSLSMRDLARALRISTGTLYHYFTNKLGLFEAILYTYGVEDISRQIKDESPSKSFEEGLDMLIAGCEKQEQLWAKIFLIQVDAYREPEGKMLEIFNNVFTSDMAGNYLKKLLHIDDDDVIDMFRALTLGLIIQRVISRKKVDWQVQKRLLAKTFKRYEVTGT